MNKLMKALANDNRRRILDWLKNPAEYFEKPKIGDLDLDGVCVTFIAKKLGISQPSTTAHMKILHEANLVMPTYISQWTYYRLNENGLKSARDQVFDLLG